MKNCSSIPIRHFGHIMSEKSLLKGFSNIYLKIIYKANVPKHFNQFHNSKAFMVIKIKETNNLKDILYRMLPTRSTNFKGR